ncbi:hypothetical protein C4577_02290 [Candidatus Parcubacteria bacterium]|nr:MAG: hypothetical protein C4577_02290 [Candidatus Parcubacteria bacterium]
MISIKSFQSPFAGFGRDIKSLAKKLGIKGVYKEKPCKRSNIGGPSGLHTDMVPVDSFEKALGSDPEPPTEDILETETVEPLESPVTGEAEKPQSPEVQPEVAPTPRSPNESTPSTANTLMAKFRERAAARKAAAAGGEGEKIETPKVFERKIEKPPPRPEITRPKEPTSSTGPREVGKPIVYEKNRFYTNEDGSTGKTTYGYLEIPTPTGTIKFVRSRRGGDFTFSEYSPVREANLKPDERGLRLGQQLELDPTKLERKKDKIRLKKEEERLGDRIQKLAREGKMKQVEKLVEKGVSLPPKGEKKGDRTAYTNPDDVVRRLEQITQSSKIEAQKLFNEFIGFDYY